MRGVVVLVLVGVGIRGDEAGKVGRQYGFLGDVARWD